VKTWLLFFFFFVVACFFLEAHPETFIAFRLPRLIVLLLTGASLAASGAIMQSLFQNPLASPSVLGISFGGSLAVTLAAALNLTHFSPLILPLAAFFGSLATLFLILSLSRGESTEGLILSGIALSTVLLACQGALLYLLRDRWQLVLMLSEWEAGSTHNLSWQEVHMEAPLALLGFWIAFRYRKELTLLSLGDEEACSLGVEVKKVRFRLILASALLAAGALAAVGIIPFFGLILPHIVRAIKGAAHPHILTFNCLWGGVILLFLDSLLQFFEISSLTVGHVSALLGGLFFLLLLFNQRAKNYA
jgi:iron complex transport system permease protein